MRASARDARRAVADYPGDFSAEIGDRRSSRPGELLGPDDPWPEARHDVNADDGQKDGIVRGYLDSGYIGHPA
jgi:hypothetical protein